MFTMDKINQAKLTFKDGRRLHLLPIHGSIEGGMLYDLATIKSLGPIWQYNAENVVVPVLLSPYMHADTALWHAWSVYPVGVKFVVTTHHIDKQLFEDNYTTWTMKFKKQNGD